MIEINHLEKSFPGQESLLKIKNVRFPSRGLIAILGDSGSGKSTLLKLIAGLDEEYSGQIIFKQKTLKTLNADELNDYRALHIGFIFQDFQLLPLDSIEDNILLPLSYLSPPDVEERKLLVSQLLKAVDLPVDARRDITALSGGEKQRVAIARSLANNPDFILADEPTGSLDRIHKQKIMALLQEISLTKLVIVVSHDQALMKEYANQIYKIERGNLVLKKNEIVEKNKTHHLSFLRTDKTRLHFRLPFSYILRHHFRTFKHKKGRTIMAQFALSLGLLALGLSFLITSSVTNQIQMMLNALFENHQLLVTSRYPGDKTQDQIASSYDDLVAIQNLYPDDIRRIGVDYTANFEEFFPDQNRLIVANSGVKKSLSSFNIRHVNEYRWLEESDGNIHPGIPLVMEDDQVILGLPITDFQSLISALYLLPLTSYEELGTYLSAHEVFLAFEVQNDNWQYADEQLFQLIGCYQSHRAEIAHRNPRWNEVILETQMRLKSTANFTAVPTLPWTMHKVFYFEVVDSPTFLEMAITTPILNRYLFNPLHFDDQSSRISSRIGLFQQMEQTLSFGYLNYILNSSVELLHYYPTSEGAYLAFPQALMVGFSRTILFGKSQEELLLVTENNILDSELTSEINIIFPPHVAIGSLKGLGKDNVRFSSNVNSLILGHKPENIEEIVISTALAEKIFGHHRIINEYLYLAASDQNVFAENPLVAPIFIFTRLKISGIIDDKQMFIYQSPTWLYTYFSLVLRVDGFLLQPQGFILKTSEKSSLTELTAKLNYQFPQLQFSIPYSELTQSVIRTTEQIERMILLIASFAIAIAFLLIIVVAYLTMIEEVSTQKLLHQIGVSPKEQQRFFLLLSPLLGGISFLVATLELSIMQVFLQKALTQYFQTSGELNFYLVPIVIMLVTALVLSLISGLIVSRLFTGEIQKRISQIKSYFRSAR
ncbi:MAG: ATP-binding cassette domain-containing protein [Bacilli bacterium]